MAASSSTSVPTATENPALNLIREQLQHLRLKLDLNSRREQSLIVSQAKSISLRKRLMVSQAKSKSILKGRRSKAVVSAQIGLLENLIKDISSASSAKKSTADEESTRPELNPGLKSNVATGFAKPRYLCVSNGNAICCLDLSKSQSLTSAQDVPPLSEIDTLNLLDDPSLPVSVGLFNLGSEAYMIGGQVFPPRIPFPHKSRGIKTYESLCWKHGIKGSSRVTCRLSLVDGTLSLTRCSIKKLKKPKFWPIVEKIDGNLHVFETIPLMCYGGRPSWIFSHEVRNPDGRWVEMETTRDRCYIRSHSVVGNRIYAVSQDKFLAFDSKAKKWEIYRSSGGVEALSPCTVWQILDSSCGIARCAGEFAHGEPGNPVYVLIAVVQREEEVEDDILQVVAYMVTSAGEIICFQRLAHFFEGCPVPPNYMYQGAIIKDDEEGKAMCMILNGTPGDKEVSTYLYINTFSVEMLTSAAPKVGQWLARRGMPLVCARSCQGQVCV